MYTCSKVHGYYSVIPIEMTSFSGLSEAFFVHLYPTRTCMYVVLTCGIEFKTLFIGTQESDYTRVITVI